MLYYLRLFAIVAAKAKYFVCMAIIIVYTPFITAEI